jgi:hypothetical protein
LHGAQHHGACGVLNTTSLDVCSSTRTPSPRPPRTSERSAQVTRLPGSAVRLSRAPGHLRRAPRFLRGSRCVIADTVSSHRSRTAARYRGTYIRSNICVCFSSLRASTRSRAALRWEPLTVSAPASEHSFCDQPPDSRRARWQQLVAPCPCSHATAAPHALCGFQARRARASWARRSITRAPNSTG